MTRGPIFCKAGGQPWKNAVIAHLAKLDDEHALAGERGEVLDEGVLELGERRAEELVERRRGHRVALSAKHHMRRILQVYFPRRSSRNVANSGWQVFHFANNVPKFA